MPAQTERNMLTEPDPGNPTTRFSNHADNYMKYRPSYPEAVVNFLEEIFNLQKHHRIADIGSGTGLFAELLLKKGYAVVCIEPNDEMRKTADNKLQQYKGFSSRKYRAEKTGLKTGSVDLITVAQAFDWMEPIATKKEFTRVLKPGGHIVLAWNIRQTHTPFLKAYDELKEQFRTDALPRKINEEKIRSFFQPGAIQEQDFPNVRWLDFDSLKGQLLSASYIPFQGHASYDTMISSLVQLFVAHEENGFVKMEYSTKLFWND